MMFRLINRSILARNLVLVNANKSSIVNRYATQAQEKPKDEDHNKINEDTIHHHEPLPEVRIDDLEINYFMNDLEKLNANKDPERVRKINEFIALPFYRRFAYFCKTLIKETYLLIKTEIFFTHYRENEKLTHDFDIESFWTFSKKENIKGWMICDHDMDKGYSSCRLGVNQQGRLKFSGHLNCDDFLKDGKQLATGYAHLSSPVKKTGFGFESHYNWSCFNHLIIRFKGDGRVYQILLKSWSLQDMQTDAFYEYFLYTRGGPYWQTAKIPFSKFVLCYQSRIQDKKQPLMSDKIQSFSITVTKYTGPYRLEISHIGLMVDSRNYQTTDYEGYFRPELY